ncbi:mannitol dehydrogenase family protein [Kineosporia sp. J2-2]|uniref:Mannitol-1-phosphate 5-dehydrogenase n=1 Tax=Kineosporia corallincola TaxID=2835133 RepID=A0ABS5TRC7_9ACTN|nr:mannitol dehydrogenase family protein [Kineosporia corallincola]MBT0773351.1 mannitol dehydrogenase family protein [Kineosporia corallincola]
MSRLSLATLDLARSRPNVTMPPVDPAGQQVGILHLGIGAFHRAHQAVITQEAAAATGDTRWGICGVTQRSDTVARQLRPQDGLYGVLERSPEGTRLQLTGSVRDVLYPEAQQDELDARFDDPAVTVITLTVTEKGYRRAGNGRLDLTDPLVAADLASNPAAGRPVSAVGRLVRGLLLRSRGCGAPVTVLCCDNLNDNGTVVAGLVADFCAALPGAVGEPLAAWIEGNVSFPCSMVDRIVPATTAADRADGQALLGLADEGLVVAEPFRQWVIEDSFVAARPAWERAGAQLTKDVAPYELMKLRILNGSHSTLAYLGALAGYATIAETVGDERLLAVARGLITEDVIPVLQAPDGTDLAAYGEQVLHRYTNPALAHRTVQIAMDGSQKLPLRLLATVRDNERAGRQARWAARGVAAWMTYLASPTARTGMPLPVDDPLAARLTASVRGRTDAGGIVDALLAYPEIFGADLPDSAWFRAQLTEDVAELL